ncbi:Bacterial Ig-like domain (group 2) [Thalassoglobus neptunius]|uniref:Bacterial Ig-like domain (Group 2) n=1 Tax=Thalassoglobus neptunius TaxID=1938619 RepID=A0A5C5VQ60_9PLAN|nr:DUF1549 domain-containing protein [Thalassoglobus neptunius]TWT40714.1 Bacterial Ig-like domain (group 2) [Thalassoglobus neptunius]
MKSCSSMTLALTAACFLANTVIAFDGTSSEVPVEEVTRLEVGPQTGDELRITGQDARVQLLITGLTQDGSTKDLTRAVEFTVSPENVLSIDETGLMTPKSDGSATVTATLGSHSTSATVHVSDFAGTKPINFKNQIVPIFTKLGCNGGGCHGKASGQNGFKLSLLGFYPRDDYEFLVKESRGRRVFPPAPERSLLLTKPIGESPHGGGKRMEKDSYEYRVLRRWIEQGMPYGEETDPVVVGIECYPPGRVLNNNDQQQVTVYATYSDGTQEDVTRMALFEPNDAELAESSETGLVSTLDLSGEVAIMARYQGQVATFRATIPLGATVSETPPVRNFIDEAVFNKLQVLGVPPSPLADDSTFLRRVYLDITGTLPTEEEVVSFLADSSPNKRSDVIDRLIDSPEYADFFANKWNMILRNKKRQNEDQAGTYTFHQWIWNQLYDNTPYDEMVSRIITASGDPQWNPAVTWYREVSDSSQQVEDVAQLFLGIRIQCAKCHHHPFEKWSENDYYGMAAFFSRVGKKGLGAERLTRSRDRRVFHNEGVAQAQNPRSKEVLEPTPLGDAPLEIPADRDPRIQLADWMAEVDNPFFAKSLVNRYWKHFFSRGIVEPEDDMRETNPPSNPELLDALARHFIASGFDLKELVRTICNSSAYQLTAFPNEYNLKDKQNFSRYYPKRLTAESLYDAFHQVTNTSETFSGMPAGTRSIQLPDSSVGPYFLKVFGQPQGDTACECERSQEANLAQSLHLLNSSEVQNKIGSDSGRAVQLASQTDRPHEDRIRELYRWVYAREPDASEKEIALNHIDQHPDNERIAYEDILWALINTKEFLFNH